MADIDDDDEKVIKPFILDLGDCFVSGAQARQGNAVDLDNIGEKSAQPVTAGTPVDPSETEMDRRYEVLEKSGSYAMYYDFDAEHVHEPPYPLDKLANLNEISMIRQACITAIAQNVVGLGYKITKIDPKEGEADSDQIADDIVELFEDWSTRDNSTFTELMYKVVYDVESTGNGYIEVSRKMNGEIDGWWHVPAPSVRVLKSQYTDTDRQKNEPTRPSYVQLKGGDRVQFYRFGDKVEFDEEGQHHYREGADRYVNEIIHFMIYSPKSPYYGAPRDIAGILSIAGDEMARNHNIKYFNNGATPELALIFEVDKAAFPTIAGDQPVKINIPENVKRQILEHFRKNLSSPTFEPALFYLPAGVTVRVERLSRGQTDSGWTKFRDANRAEIRNIFRVPPIVLGDSDAGNYASASVQKQNFLEQVIVPAQNTLQQKLMNLIWPELVMIKPATVPPVVDENGEMSVPPQNKVAPEEGTGVNKRVWVLQFNQMRVYDKTVDAQNDNIYGGLGVKTINEMRRGIGLKPFEDGDKAPAPPKGENGDTVGARHPAPGDIRGLRLVDGSGRTENGAINTPQPRRVLENGVPVPANASTVGQPGASYMGKRDDEFEDENENENEIEIQIIGLEDATPEDLEFDSEAYLKKIEDGFNTYIDPNAGYNDTE
jgi:PBSX family phage portal protein